MCHFFMCLYIKLSCTATEVSDYGQLTKVAMIQCLICVLVKAADNSSLGGWYKSIQRMTQLAGTRKTCLTLKKDNVALLLTDQDITRDKLTHHVLLLVSL